MYKEIIKKNLRILFILTLLLFIILTAKSVMDYNKLRSEVIFKVFYDDSFKLQVFDLKGFLASEFTRQNNQLLGYEGRNYILYKKTFDKITNNEEIEIILQRDFEKVKTQLKNRLNDFLNTIYALEDKTPPLKYRNNVIETNAGMIVMINLLDSIKDHYENDSNDIFFVSEKKIKLISEKKQSNLIKNIIIFLFLEFLLFLFIIWLELSKINQKK